MNIEQALNSIAGQVLDYDLISNNTLFALVKSEKGNISIRQAFRNKYGAYNGFKMVKMIKSGEELARLDFSDFIENLR